jgi:Cd(II)/Pb(II)-responsive transcriptional regulator
MQIGELARRFGVTVDAIRYYEREGLLTRARRTRGNYRMYDESHVRELSFVLNCRALDMTQEEIKALTDIRSAPGRDCFDVNQLVDGHIEQVSRRITELKQLLTDLKALRQSCVDARTVQQCEILSTLARPAPDAKRRRR